MQICVATSDTDLIYVEADPQNTIEDLKALIEVQTGTPMAKQALLFQGVRLSDASMVSAVGLQHGDIVQLLIKNDQIQAQALSLLNNFRANPSFASYLDYHNPPLADAVRSQNLEEIEAILTAVAHNTSRRQEQANKQMRLMNADPFDLDAQAEIERQIQQKNIDENLEYAQEFTPEVFGSVIMLYIDCEVNDTKLQAFVDSGAQNTIMSKECAERIGITRLIDRRFQGEARGVGVGKIIGRVHAANIKIGGILLNCCFHVLEMSDIDLLFGLDMLKRHQCCIDLNKNVLSLHSGQVEVPFLSEGQINRLRQSVIMPDSPILSRGPSGSSERNPGAPNPPSASNPSSAPSNPSSVPSNPSSAPPNADDDITKLVKLGFSREQAQQALRTCGGNVDMAASLLFQQRSPF